MSKQLSVVPPKIRDASDDELNAMANELATGLSEAAAIADASVARINGAETMRTNLARITQSMIVTLEKRRDEEDDRLKGVQAASTTKAEALIDQATKRIEELMALVQNESANIKAIQAEITRSAAASERDVLASRETFNAMIVAQQVALKAIG